MDPLDDDMCPSEIEDDVHPNVQKLRRIANPDSHRLLYSTKPGPPDHGFIYVGVCESNGKMYVGQHRHSKKGESWRTSRLRVHERSAGCVVLHRALQKHTFEWFALDEVPADVLDEYERIWIADLKTLHPDGYNLDEGGSGGRHCELSNQKRRATMATPESKAKRSSLTKSQWAKGGLRKANAEAAERRLVARLDEATRLAVPDVPNKDRVHNAYYIIGDKIFRYRKSGRGVLEEMSREAIEAQRECKKKENRRRRGLI